MQKEIVIGMERIFSNIKKSWKYFVIIMAIAIIASVALAVPSNDVTDIINNGEDASSLYGREVTLIMENSFVEEDLSGEELSAAMDKVTTYVYTVISYLDTEAFKNGLNEQLAAKNYDLLTEDDHIVYENRYYDTVTVLTYGYGDERIDTISDYTVNFLEKVATENYDMNAFKVVLDSEVKPVAVDEAGELNWGDPDVVSDENETNDTAASNGGTSFIDRLISKKTILIGVFAVFVWAVVVICKTLTDRKIYTKSDVDCFENLQFLADTKNMEFAKCILNNLSQKQENICILNYKNDEIPAELAGTDGKAIKVKSIDSLKDEDSVILLLNAGADDVDSLSNLVSLLESVQVNVLGYILVY